jgi:hypothetical protein
MNNEANPRPEEIRIQTSSIKQRWDRQTATRRRASALARQEELLQRLGLNERFSTFAVEASRTSLA